MDQPAPDYPIQTGATEDRGRYGRHLVFASIGWLLAAALVAWLVIRASEVQIRMTLFIVTMCVLIALIGIALVVEIFSRAMIETPAAPGPITVGLDVDALHRPIEIPEDPGSLRGTITLESRDGVRIYGEGT